MKKILLSALCLAAAVNLYADNPSGNLPEANMAWTLNDGVLTISVLDKNSEDEQFQADGTVIGMIPTFDDAEDNPWNNYRQDINEVVVEDGIIQIAASCAFGQCYYMERVTLPEQLMLIGPMAFYQCSALPTIQLPAGLLWMQQFAFAECTALEQIEFPDALRRWEKGLCYGCTALRTVKLPETVEIDVIPEQMFAECTALEQIDLPANITEISDYAFYGCTALKKITCNYTEDVVTLASNAFDEIADPKQIIVYVPGDLKEQYEADTDWSQCTICAIGEEPVEEQGLEEVLGARSFSPATTHKVMLDGTLYMVTPEGTCIDVQGKTVR